MVVHFPIAILLAGAICRFRCLGCLGVELFQGKILENVTNQPGIDIVLENTRVGFRGIGKAIGALIVRELYNGYRRVGVAQRDTGIYLEQRPGWG